jgi:hypothetical protein
LNEIKGIAFCAVFGPIIVADLDEDYVDLSFAISSKGIEIETRPRYIKLPSVLSSNHVWLEYLVLEPFVLEEDDLQVRFLMSSELFIKSCGVRLIHKHEENAKDHPSLTHMDFNFSFYDRWSETVECSGHDEFEDYEFKKAERLLYGIQSKRCRDDDDDDDSNLKSGLHPQQKRRSSTLGESQLNQSENSQRSHLPTYFGKDPLMLVTC